MSGNNQTYNFFRVHQPIGEFLLTIIPAKELLSFYSINRRQYTNDKGEGTQRKFNSDRVSKIADFVVTSDSSFPTSIVIAVDEGDYKIKENQIQIINRVEIIDGQHRILGLEKALDKYGPESVSAFNLPCLIMIEPTEEQKAFVFATINGKQQKVNSSVIYDLFGVSSDKDPFTLLHSLARALNFEKESPFFKRIKMLGVKTVDVETESISQGTFIKTLIPHITNNALKDRDIMKNGDYTLLEKIPLEKAILRPYLIKYNLSGLINLFENIFNATSEVWENEWTNHNDYILSKTTGYIGLMKKAIIPIIANGYKKQNLKKEYFFEIFNEAKKIIEQDNKELTSEHFPSGAVGEKRFEEYIKKAFQEYLKNQEEAPQVQT